MTHLEQNRLLNSQRYGFRPKSNTNSALVDLTNFIQQNRDSNKIVTAIFIDIKKAFDTVVKSTLLKKLQEMGVIGKEHIWF